MKGKFLSRSAEGDLQTCVATCPGLFRQTARSTYHDSAVLPAKHLRYRGIALIWSAIFLLLMILVMGLCLDVAKVCVVTHQMHNAADAGALAGACVVKWDQTLAREQAIAIAAANYADHESVFVADNPTNDPNADVVLGRWIRQMRMFIPTTEGCNAVKVVARRTDAHELVAGKGGPVPYIFGGPLADVYEGDFERYTIAKCDGSLGAGIMTLADDPSGYPGWGRPTGFWLHGTVSLDIGLGDIQVNSWADSGSGMWQAVRVNGETVTINAGEFNVVGATSPEADDGEGWETFWADPFLPAAINPSSPRVDDPLLALNPPDIPSGVATHYGEYEYYDADAGGLVTASEYEFVEPVTEDTIALLGEISPTNPNLKVLTLDPGYYPAGINMNSGSGRVLVGYHSEPNPDPNLPDIQVPDYETYEVELRLNRGGTVETSLYALGGGPSGGSGLIIKGSASLYGEYVTLYVTGAHNGYDVEYGTLDIGGNGYVEVSPPGNYSEFYEPDPDTGEMVPAINGQPGISFWQDIDNHNKATIIGTSDFDLQGTLYFPDNHLEIGGGGFTAGNQILAGSLDMHGGGPDGQGNLCVAYDGRNRDENYRAHIVW